MIVPLVSAEPARAAITSDGAMATAPTRIAAAALAKSAIASSAKTATVRAI